MSTLYDLGATSVYGYQLRTGDTSTAASAVTGALVEAEALIEEELRRDLALQSRDESMIIRDFDGRMYPRAWPITACATNTIDGRTLLGGAPDVETWFTFVGTTTPTPRVTITYTGGFDATTLPVTLAHAIYDLAWSLAADVSPIPVGATSVSVGDVSVSYGSSSSSGGVDAYVAGLSARIAKYRNRWV